MKLYSYWRSTTSYRVRVALNYKGLEYDTQTVDLVAGEQSKEDYIALNPGRGVPTLIMHDGVALTQSMAILEWLEEKYPDPALLPADTTERARVRAAALAIATDIHPVNNLRVVGELKQNGFSQENCVAWMNNWMTQGFTAFQSMIYANTQYSFGNSPSLADICLVPQLYNARRWGCELSPFPRLVDIETHCLALPAFDKARPENQSDAA